MIWPKHIEDRTCLKNPAGTTLVASGAGKTASTIFLRSLVESIGSMDNKAYRAKMWSILRITNNYAVDQFEKDGEVIKQPVIDWVGASPMRGILITYTKDFDPDSANTGERIRLIDAKNDVCVYKANKAAMNRNEKVALQYR